MGKNLLILLEKSLAALLLLFLPACSHKNSWVYQEIKTKPITSNSANLRIPAATAFNGLELQFLKGNFGTRAYLNVYAREIPRQTNDPVVIVVDDQPYSFTAIRMEGDQRLLLPEEAAQLLVSALSNRQKVIVGAPGGFSSEIPSKKFGKLYRKFEKVQTSKHNLLKVSE